MNWWVHDLVQQGRTVELISRVFWVIFAITLHELAHGWAALWQGDDTPRRLGRMTANPMVHMGATSIIIFLLVGFAWGLMPVDPSRFRWGRRGRMAVAAAGPAMNFALALVSLTLLVLWHRFGPAGTQIFDNLTVFLFVGGFFNIVLGLFNLLPIPPLDGSEVLSGLSRRAYRFFHQPQAPMYGMFVVLAIFWSGLGGILFDVSGEMARAYWQFGVRLLSPAPTIDIPG